MDVSVGRCVGRCVMSISISQKIHAAYESALVDTGVSYPRVLCAVCRSCKVCGVKKRGEQQLFPVGISQHNPRRKSKEKIHDEGPSQDYDIQTLEYELSSALSRIETLSSLNLRAFEDLADEKNKFSKLKKIYKETQEQLSSLHSQEKLYEEKISKLEASLKLSEACRSQTTKEMKRSKLETQSLQREVIEVQTRSTLEKTSKSNQLMFEKFSSDEHEKSRQILVTVESDLRALIELLCQWNRSLESIFMTQPNHEQEWLGLLNGLCLSIVERIDIVNHLLEHE
jgi:hypothetical protein